MPQRRVTFYHSPNTRSAGTLALLLELHAAFDLVEVNMKAGEQRQSGYLAINPMGKVPAIVHEGALVTEQPAIFLYLADLWGEARLAPALVGDPLRGPYLRWLTMYGSCFEPAVVDRYMKHELAPTSTTPYGDFDTLLNVIDNQLAEGPWLFASRFTAADILWGTGLAWTTAFKLVPETPNIMAYVKRVMDRPASQEVKQIDAEMAARHAAAAGKA